MVDPWKAINHFFEENSLVNQQIDSFNFFLDHSLSSIIKENKSTSLGDTKNTKIEISNIHITSPFHIENDGIHNMILPFETRIRNLTYSSSVYIDIHIVNNEDAPLVFKNCLLCKLPMMIGCKLCNLQLEDIKSKECQYDNGGFFIINGSEKVLIAQEKMNNNQVYVFAKKPPNKYQFVSELRGVKDKEIKSTSTININITNPNSKNERFIKIMLPFLKTEIPIFFIFYIFGCKNHKDILECFTLDEKDKFILLPSLLEATVYSQEEAFAFIESKMLYNYDIKTMKNEIMVHVDEHEKKLQMMIYMIEQLILCVQGKRKDDDRDHYKNKRIDLSGQLIAGLFRQLFKRTFKEFINGSVKALKSGKLFNIHYLLKTKIITNGLKYSLATGNWGIGSSCNVRNGVSQVLNRLTFSSTLSHLRRINSPIGRDGKLTSPRHLHNSHWGKVCPSETPEGQACGLVKNLSLMSYVSTFSDSDGIKNICKSFIDVEKLIKGYTNVFVNGCLLGAVKDKRCIIESLRHYRRTGSIAFDVSIVYDTYKSEIRVNTDAGRICRPLFIVVNKCINEDGMNNAKTWSDLLMSSTIEYIDSDEEENLYIALFQHQLKQDFYTHCEIHPSMILGVCASTIPFANHNQSPRNTYQCLDPEENVLMADGTRKPIKNVIIGDQVKSFCPKTLTYKNTKVINQYVKPTTKDIYTLVTISGRKITATYDHKFMTDHGWVAMKEAYDNNYKVGVSFDYTEKWSLQNTDKQIGDCKQMGILTRLIGYVFMEGDYNNSKVIEDIKQLGFDILSFKELVSNLMPNNKLIPEWIENASIYIQTEFVRGMFSGNKFETLKMSISSQDCIEKRKFVKKVLQQNDIETYDKLEIVKVKQEDEKNVIRFFDTIGYPYNIKNNLEIGVYVEYLKVLGNGLSMTFETFTDMIDINENSCFIPIQTIRKQEHKNMIADITVDADEHSFIGGNNFMIHNSAMGKQAIGLYATNFKTRLDTLSHVLNYPQQPLVKTNMSTLLNLSNMPCGTNVIVAIATYTGYNQEDSIILNRSSVQRGLFTSTFYRTLKEQCNKNLSTGEEEIFCNPTEMESFVNKPQNYDKIDEHGFVSENTFVEAGDVIIGKCMPQKTSTSFFHKDNSITMKNNEIGYIDMSCTNDNYFKNTSADGYSFCKIKIRNFREPTIGDKLSSNHAQKGSIGVMYSQEDLPYTKDGLVPDIIINPHAIPSRMTIAQLIETIMGKACASLGTVGNATPFTSISVNDICNILGNDCNLEPHGNQLMYNSRTGEQMKTSIFIGPTYYQRLKHMVCDKIHSRNSNGPVVLLTRQPAEGRARDGGLRLGEMEVECNWGHGTMNFLKERFIDCSDNYRVFTCKKCGNIANVNPGQNIYTCNLCNNKTTFSEIRIPFASKLLFQEIQSMGINTKFYT